MSVKKINISGNEYDIKDANAQAMISDEFDSGTSYTTGDYCIYENVLYKFTSDKSAGAWDSGKVAATNIDTELSSLNSSIVVNEFLKTQDILESVQSYVTFNEEMIPDGYSVITAWCTSEHPSSVLCGGPYVEKNMAIAPYIANQPEQGEKFHLYIALKRS